MISLRAALLSAIVAGSAFTTIASACLHVPPGYENTVGQTQQRAVVVHDGTYQDMILSVDWHVEGADPAARLGWIVTVPNEPVVYDVWDEAIFNDAGNLAWRLLKQEEPMPFGVAGSARPRAAGVEIGETVEAGPYQITPVRGVGHQAFEGMNAWLAAEDLGTVTEDHIRWFIDRNYTFLCIRMDPPEGAESVGSGGEAPPLRLRFACEDLYYPLLFSSRQGVFDVNITTFTADPIDYQASADSLDRMMWKNRFYWTRNHILASDEKIPASIHRLLSLSAPESDAFFGWHLNFFDCNRVNDQRPIMEWTDDIMLKLTPRDENPYATEETTAP